MRAAKRFVYRNWQRVHGVRRLELAVLSRYLNLTGRQRVLDVGSGKGAFCGELARAGHSVVGVDPSTPAAAIAKTYVNPGGDFVLGGGEALPFSDERFDRVISVCVLEHTKDDLRVLREVRRVLKPGGLFALTVDCLDSPFISETFRRHHREEYRCNQLYSDTKLRELLVRAGFEVQETEYLFAGRLSIAILRFGSLFHYRSVFILLFPILYPLLLLDRALSPKPTSGMILAAKAVRRESLAPTGGSRPT
jgi:SAM-dependent methyltransferase